MHVHRLLAGAAAAVTAMVLAACGSASTPAGADSTGAATGASDATSMSGEGSAPDLRIVASTNVYGDIAATIAGGHAEITSIISNPSADPHAYEANAQNQLALSKADVIIENGGGYDDFIDTMLAAVGNPSATVLNAVDLSGMRAADGEHLNEHVWYDLPSMATLADAIATALGHADAANAAAYRANAATFTSHLTALEDLEQTIKDAHAGTPVAITEPVPLHLLTAAGLVNKTPEAFSDAIEEGHGVPPAALKETLDLLANGEVALLVYNEQATGPETERILDTARNNNVAVVAVTETLPSGTGYLNWMKANLTAVQAALG